MKNKYIVVNYIPKDVFDNLEHLKNLHPLITQLNLEIFNSKELSMFFVLRSLLFCITKQNPSEILSYCELKDFLSNVLSIFYQFNLDGYVNQQNMESNKIFNIFRSFYPYYKDVFAQNKKYLSWNHELEHFHNLIILTLIFEIELYIKHFSQSENGNTCDSMKEIVCLLKQEKTELTKTLSGGIRASLSKNRLICIDRIYIGFDTEYNNIDSQTNNILCYTTASISEGLLKIRSNSVDYSLKEGKVYLPKTANLIATGVKLIRLLRCKKDREIEKLDSFLKENKELERITLNNQDVIYKQKSFAVNEIRTEFYDVRIDKSRFSLRNLLDANINSFFDSIPNTKRFRDYTTNLGLKPVFRSECYLIAHFTAADVSLFSDFEQVKKNFTVLNKSFLSLNTSYSYRKWKVILRDSSLLSPAGMSLKSIGSLYPDLPLEKIELGSKNLHRMDLLFNNNEKLFRSYAIQDSKIVLWHSLQVLNSHFLLTGKYSIPVTLSSLASSFLKKRLIDEENKDSSYHPTTKNGLISVKNLAKLNTPIGIELSGDLHEYIDYFLGSYHGGRNESYIYGVITGGFFDYDLPGAYPTAMAMLDYPNWSKKVNVGKVSGVDFFELYGQKLIKSYTALKIKFKFPETIKYPNLPVRLDLSSVIFPLEGETFCTGIEFYLAMKMKCQIEILGGVYIPFIPSKKEKGNEKNLKKENLKKEFFIKDPKLNKIENQLETQIRNQLTNNYIEKVYETPKSLLSSNIDVDVVNNNFYSIVKELLVERLKYPKGSYMNLLYKFLANAGIGQMARGLNQKVRYDSQTNSTKILPSGDLISPLYAGWITSFIRTTLSEIMNKNSIESIVSCTTDGFITNTPNLENYIPCSKEIFSRMYYDMRLSLTGKGELLERKYYEPKGVISWRTRGQLGLSGGIKALTGYQRNEPIEQTITKVFDSINATKIIPFIQKSLRSAKEIYQKGGHSTIKLNERNFNLKFDNRREIVEDHGTYCTTKPFVHSFNSVQARLISSFGSGKYRVYSPISSTQCKGDAYLTLTRRMLVRILRDDLSQNLKLNLNRSEIARVMGEIGLSCSLNFISKQKDRKVIYNSIPPTEKTLVVLEKFNRVFPSFDKNLFLRN